MRFENGMLGFLIVVLALGGSIFGTVLLSAEESTHDVTKYRYETEVTGLFPVDTSPEYFDYDLARNYTGYYTADTEINGVKYWGGASFRETGVNNYPVRSAPSDTSSSTITITGLSQSNPPDDKRMATMVYGQSGVESGSAGTMGNLVVNSSTTTKSSTLQSLIQANDLVDYDKITITPTSSSAADRVLFASTDDFVLTDNTYPFYWRDYVEYDSREIYTQSRWANITMPTLVACLSCTIDTVTQTANFYYSDTPSTQTFIRSVELDKAVILYGSTNVPPAFVGLSDVVNLEGLDYPDIQYMDISQGVTVTGVTA